VSDATASDRRIHERIDLELPVRVSGAGSPDSGEVEAQSVNISEGGVLLAGSDFPTGSVVRLEIELAEMGWHALDAEVVRRGDAPGGGKALAASFASAATEGGRDAIRAFFASRLSAAEGAAQD
jgi:c-di-GMP-binding flagellar brake protein YcgR